MPNTKCRLLKLDGTLDAFEKDIKSGKLVSAYT